MGTDRPKSGKSVSFGVAIEERGETVDTTSGTPAHKRRVGNAHALIANAMVGRTHNIWNFRGRSGRHAADAEPYRERADRGFVFPATIAGLRFEKALHTEKGNTSCRYGLYRDASGQDAFAKVLPKNGFWNRRRIDTERTAYEYVRQALCNNPEIGKSFPHVHIPELLAFHEDEHSIAILLENRPWKPLRDEPLEKKRHVYGMVSDYFRNLGAGDDVPKVPRRTLLFWTMKTPLYAVCALLRHPSSAHTVIVGSAMCLLWAVFALFRRQKYVFAHGDLGEWNILVRDNDVAVIDFELAAVTLPASDAAAIGLGYWETLIREGRVGKEKDLDFLIMDGRESEFHAMAVHLAICNLGIPDGKPANVARTFLKYCIGRWSRSVFQSGSSVNR
jgi:hypothetical protein